MNVVRRHGGAFDVAASSWNGAAFTTSAFIETTGDEGSVDPSQDIFDA